MTTWSEEKGGQGFCDNNTKAFGSNKTCDDGERGGGGQTIVQNCETTFMYDP